MFRFSARSNCPRYGELIGNMVTNRLPYLDHMLILEVVARRHEWDLAPCPCF